MKQGCNVNPSDMRRKDAEQMLNVVEVDLVMQVAYVRLGVDSRLFWSVVALRLNTSPTSHAYQLWQMEEIRVLQCS